MGGDEGRAREVGGADGLIITRPSDHGIFFVLTVIHLIFTNVFTNLCYKNRFELLGEP